MSSETQREKLEEIVKEEELLNNLIQTAISEGDSLVEANQPQVLGWLRWLEQLVEDDPPKFDVLPIPGVPIQKGSFSCNLCEKKFDCSLNRGRHEWKHKDILYEAKMKEQEADFKDFWQKLEEEKTLDIVSINNIVVQVNVYLQEKLQTLKAVDIVDFVDDHVNAPMKSSPFQRRHILARSLLGFVIGCASLSTNVLLQALTNLSEDNFLRGTLLPEMQQIVFRHARMTDESQAENLVALFGFFVEYCVVKSWSDYLEEKVGHNSGMLAGKGKEEEKDKQSTVADSKQKKLSKSQRKRAKEKQKCQSNVNEGTTVDSSSEPPEGTHEEARTTQQATSLPVIMLTAEDTVSKETTVDSLSEPPEDTHEEARTTQQANSISVISLTAEDTVSKETTVDSLPEHHGGQATTTEQATSSAVPPSDTEQHKPSKSQRKKEKGKQKIESRLNEGNAADRSSECPEDTFEPGSINVEPTLLGSAVSNMPTEESIVDEENFLDSSSERSGDTLEQATTTEQANSNTIQPGTVSSGSSDWKMVHSRKTYMHRLYPHSGRGSSRNQRGRGRSYPHRGRGSSSNQRGRGRSKIGLEHIKQYSMHQQHSRPEINKTKALSRLSRELTGCARETSSMSMELGGTGEASGGPSGISSNIGVTFLEESEFPPLGHPTNAPSKHQIRAEANKEVANLSTTKRLNHKGTSSVDGRYSDKNTQQGRTKAAKSSVSVPMSHGPHSPFLGTQTQERVPSLIQVGTVESQILSNVIPPPEVPYPEDARANVDGGHALAPNFPPHTHGAVHPLGPGDHLNVIEAGNASEERVTYEGSSSQAVPDAGDTSNTDVDPYLLYLSFLKQNWIDCINSPSCMTLSQYERMFQKSP